MSTSDDSLVVRDLVARYRAMTAVDGVNLEVARGELVMVVGRNGAGKTTAMATIAGIRHGKAEGTIRVGTTPLHRCTPTQVLCHGVAFVPEGHRIFPSLAVEENLRLGAYNRRRQGRQAIRETLDIVYSLFPVLPTFGRRRGSQLSGGEQQMVAIGQALMARPRFLLLDEPSSALAPLVVQDIYEALTSLRREGMGLLVIEQDIDRALASGDRCYVMDDGRTVLEGPCAQLSGNQQVRDIVMGITPVS